MRPPRKPWTAWGEPSTANRISRIEQSLSGGLLTAVEPTFTAITTCPGCGTIAVHGLRAANPPGMQPTFLNSYPKRTDDGGWRTAFHEEGFEVIRSCDCGAEWGQR